MQRFVIGMIAMTLAACSANDRSYLLTYDQAKQAHYNKDATAVASPAAPPIVMATSRPPDMPPPAVMPTETVVQPSPPVAAAPVVVATAPPAALAAPAYQPPVAETVPTETIVTSDTAPATAVVSTTPAYDPPAVVASATPVPRETVVTPVHDDAPIAAPVSMRAVSPAKEAKCRDVGDLRARDAANNGYTENLQAAIRDKAMQDCLRFTPDSN